MSRKTGPSTSSTPPTASSNAPSTAAANSRPGRPLWVRTLALCVLVSLSAVTVIVYWPQPRPETAIAVAANKAKPEIAPLLREINDVALDVIEAYPESPEALDVMARLDYRFGESQEAVNYWTRAIELNTQFCPAYHSMGLLYLEIGEHAKAAEYFRKALELEPGSPAFSVELAQALLASGQAAEGIEILKTNLNSNPKAVATLAMLGHGYLQVRDYAAAKQYFLQVLELAPEYTNAYDGLTRACANLKEDELAKQYAEKLKQLKERDSETHRSSLKAFDDVENVKSVMSEIYTAAANVHLHHDMPQPAEAYLKRALELTPTCIPAAEVLTWLYQIQGRKADSVRALQALLKAAPDRAAVHVTCADLCAELDMDEDAEASYRKAMELTPLKAGGYLNLARFLIQKRRKPEEAKTLAQKAVEMEPNGQAYYWLAAACQLNNDKPGALAAIERAAQLEPSNPEFQKVYQMVRQQ